MDLVLARTFLAIVETGSFKTAAEKLYVTQSTVSSRMKSLELALGKQLFERLKSGTQLTPAGEQFYRHAIAFLRIWQHAKLEVGLADHHSDHLAIGAQVSLWEGFLLKWVAWMRNYKADIAITATFDSSSHLMERLSEGTLDFVVAYRVQARPGIVIEHIFDDELCLITSGDDRGRRPGLDYVFVNWGPEFASDHADTYPEVVRAGLHLDLGAVAINYLLDAKASAYFPARIARPYLNTGQLKLVRRARRFVYPVYVAYSEEHNEEIYGPALTQIRELADEVGAS